MSEHEAPTPETGLSSDDRTWAMLAHILSILTGFIAPLIIWLIKKEDSEFVDDQAKEALNFQITVLLAFIVCSLLVCAGGIGVFLMPVVGLVALVLSIVAGIKAHEGVRYRYPWALRLI